MALLRNFSGKLQRTALMLVIFVASMLGLAFAFPPLYETFCRVTGFDGTTGFATREADKVVDRLLTVKFNTGSADPRLKFTYSQRRQRVKVGQTNFALFEAVNESDQPLLATATYNVVPLKMGSYFKKLDCFCFEERYFAPGEKVSLPIVYYIDPEIEKNSFLDDLPELTLSYTFLGFKDATP